MIRVMGRHGLSQRHECALVGLDPVDFALLALQTTGGTRRRDSGLRELAAGRRRFGCRRLGRMGRTKVTR